MDVLTTVTDMIEARDLAQRPLGLVPTMGYLHEGHMALVKCARQQNRTVIVSIFVNPTQFDSTKDLDIYPKNIERDLHILKKQNVEIVFAPTEGEMYTSDHDTWVEVREAESSLEGMMRPGHFQGVATIVSKLLAIVRPDRSYFGQKDWQQAMMIKRMNKDLNLGSEIIVVPTVRDLDGLAMSSRNVYLGEDERRAATVLYRSLLRVLELHQNGQKDATKLRQEMTDMIHGEPLAHLDYVSIAEATTLKELDKIHKPALVSVAARFGNARLIDNILIS